MPCASTADQTYKRTCAQLTACVKLSRLIHRWTKLRWMNFCEQVAPAQFPCCVECERADAVLNCVNCSATLCQECFDDTHRSKIMRTHKTSTIEATVRQTQQPLACSAHPNQPMKFVCSRDHELTCLACAALTHFGHNTIDIAQYSEPAQVQTSTAASIQALKDALGDVNSTNMTSDGSIPRCTQL